MFDFNAEYENRLGQKFFAFFFFLKKVFDQFAKFRKFVLKIDIFLGIGVGEGV